MLGVPLSSAEGPGAAVTEHSANNVSANPTLVLGVVAILLFAAITMTCAGLLDTPVHEVLALMQLSCIWAGCILLVLTAGFFVMQYWVTC